MSKTTARPDGHPPQAVWPPRVSMQSGSVTVTDGSSVAKPTVPEGGFGVRIGAMPMSGDRPREDGASEMPTEGPGVARRAIPAPEEAETTSTIPPPETFGNVDGDQDVTPRPTTTTTVPVPSVSVRQKARGK